MYYLDGEQFINVLKVYKKAYPALRDDEIFYKMYCDRLIPNITSKDDVVDDLRKDGVINEK